LSSASVLAELKLSALGETALHVGAADGPLLHRVSLPYPLPIDEAEADLAS
jgi:hypothetical protein